MPLKNLYILCFLLSFLFLAFISFEVIVINKAITEDNRVIKNEYFELVDVNWTIKDAYSKLDAENERLKVLLEENGVEYE